MNVVDYLFEYQDKSFKEEPFNELDALAFALISYFPFDLFKQKVIKRKDIINFLKTYEIEEPTSRKENDKKLLSIFAHGDRFKGLVFSNFIKKRNTEFQEQFQAITITLNNFIYVSFCGTDGTALGWREDFNMSFLDIVPAEVDAIKYINEVRQSHPFRKIYIGGHSKGGRLAIRAGKELYKTNNFVSSFSFDGPNFTDSFYDEQYELRKDRFKHYATSGTIIGRLIGDREDKIIVTSSNQGFLEHDAYSWLTEDNHFVYAEKYTDFSNKLTSIMKNVIDKYDEHTKYVIVSAVFETLEREGIDKIKIDFSKSKFKLALGAIKMFFRNWKEYTKEQQKAILEIFFELSMVLTNN